MKSTLCLATTLAAWSLLHPGIGDARRLMEQGKPHEAVKVIDDLLEERPDDPWLLYNRATAAYAARDFEKADEIWQRLAGWDLPEPLREKVWTQIGNVSFRLAEEVMAEETGVATARLEQSREAYRVAMSQSKQSDIAPKNLAYVEQRLERHYVQLADRLTTQASNEPAHDPAIEKLHAALEYQRNAINLNPLEPDYTQREGRILKGIAGRITSRGTEAEKEGDRVAEQRNLDEWNLGAAREHYDRALADFREAQTYDPAKLDAKEGQQRVMDKMAGMYVRAGREKRIEGDKQSKNEPPNAFQNYDQALAHFEQALKIKPAHEDATTGRKEVLDAMEQLHLREGDKMTKSGDKQLRKNPGEAAANLVGALDHFEQAQTINPQNPEIPPRIEHVRKLLPDVLVQMGQEEQDRARDAEPKSIPKAIAHLEQAEAGYDKALQIEKDNLPAKPGIEEVREDLARLRKLLAQENEKQQLQQGKPKNDQSQPSFAAMVAQVRAKQEEREAKAKKQRGGSQQQQRGGNLRDW